MPERTPSDRTLENESSKDAREDHGASNEKSDEHGTEEKQDNGPPLPIGFWDPQLKKARREVVLGWARTVLILMVFILTVLSLYWAVLYRVPENMKSLTVAIVDMDSRSPPYDTVQPVIGPAMVQAAQMQASKPQGLGYVVRDPAMYNFDPLAVRRSIYHQDDWVAIIISNNATALLQEAVATGNANYDPLGVAQIVYVQARDETTYANYILPTVDQFQVNFQSMFGQQWITTVLSNTSLDAATYSRAPQALNPAIGFSTFNLRPFEPATATPAVTIGLIYLIIISFFSFAFFLPIHTKFITPQGHAPLLFWQFVIWRLFATIMAYFFLSLAYSFVSLAFQIPFSNTYPHDDVSVAVAPNAYGKATFVVYWMVNFLGMCALGLASENVSMVIGQPWTALWLIFWVITNVSTSFYSLILAPGFYKWGYAWPLYHIVRASRTVIFDVRSTIGLNIGVLCAWAFVNCTLFPVACVIMRWKSNKETAEKAPRSKVKYLLSG